MKIVREEEVELRGIEFVKQVGFKPGVKERGESRSYRMKTVFFSALDARYELTCIATF